MPQRATLDGKFEETYRAERSAPSRVLVCCSLCRCLRGAGISAHAVAATLAVSLALALTGCSTPVLKSSVEVPGQFAASPAEQTEPEAAWWESFGDPVLSDLVRRSAQREPRHQDRRPARARSPGRRDGQSLVAVPEHRRGRCGARLRHRVRLARQAGRSGYQGSRRRRRCVLGSRSLRTPAGGCFGGRRRRDGGRRQCARRAPAGDDRRRDQLLHAGRRAAPARDRARDIGGAGRDAAPGIRPAACGPRYAVRRRARPDRSFAARVRRYRRWRRSPQCRATASRYSSEIRRSMPRAWCLGAARSPFRRLTPGSPRRCCNAGRTCSPCRRNWMRPMRAGGRPRRSISRGCFSAHCSVARAWSSTASTRARRASAWWPGCWRCPSSTRGGRGPSTRSPRAVSPRR